MNFNFKSSDIEKHSAAHVLAAAVKTLFPNTPVGIGPVTKAGFFYDFDLQVELDDQILSQIETRANEIIKEDLPFKQIILDKQSAYNMLLQKGEVYKAELIQSIPDESVSLYNLGEIFLDLCRGPHVSRTGELGIIKLIKTEATNWKEDPKRPALKRIYGVIFQNENEYKDYLESQNKLRLRDFMKVGVENNIIAANKGEFKFITPIGFNILTSIINYIKKNFKGNKSITIAPTNSLDLDSLNKYFDDTFRLKIRSYKNLPITFDYSSSMPFELNDKLINFPNYLTKTYLPESKFLYSIGQVIEDLTGMLDLITFKNYTVELIAANIESPVIKTISNVLEKNLISHSKVIENIPANLLNIVFKTTDSINKEWKLFEININLSSELKFRSNENKNDPVSSILINYNLLDILAYQLEEFGLNFHPIFRPWQAVVIPQSKNEIEFASALKDMVTKLNVRVRLDDRSRSFKSKIKDAEKKSIPFILVVGKKEILNKSVSVRHSGNELGLIGVDNLRNTLKEGLS